ncbi:MAG: ATP-grasp domain-containing protein [Clostridiales bacterium]|nr:ATP-grasp domain-containing protein [Clostridiales bacterium]
MESFSDKSILILGASELQVPAIVAAKKRGLETYVVDFDENATGIPFADHFYNISTLDYEKILSLAKEKKINGIMTICSDRPMMVIARVAKELGLHAISPESAYLATNKAAMRKALREENVPVPGFEIVNDFHTFLLSAEHFPNSFIVKPSDNSGSRGITLVNRYDEWEPAYNYASENSSDGVVLIEEYMDGPEVSVEIMVSHGKVQVIQITDKITTGAPHFVEMGHTQPSRLSENIKNQIKKISIDAVKALKITTGPAHVEVKVTKEGVKIVELGARLGGDYITTDLVELSTGYDMVDAAVLCSLGNEVTAEFLESRHSAIRYFSFNQYVNLTRNIISKMERMYINKLDVSEVKSSRDREAFFIVSADTEKELDKKIYEIEEGIL